jgi:hydroxypyruvate isomerase
MNRRTFSKTLAGAAALAANADKALSAVDESVPPFQLSVMLWTILRDHPFGERLEKCVEAGYKNIELVGEYHKWSEDEFSGNIAKARELGVFFDVTAGLKHAVGNPTDREAFLSDVRNELPIMERLNCPAVIVMSGNVAPGMPRQTQHESCIEGLKRAAAKIIIRVQGKDTPRCPACAGSH